MLLWHGSIEDGLQWFAVFTKERRTKCAVTLDNLMQITLYSNHCQLVLNWWKLYFEAWELFQGTKILQLPAILQSILSSTSRTHPSNCDSSIYLYSGRTKSANVFGSSKLCAPSPCAWWSWAWGSSVGPTYSIFRTLPHSGHLSIGRSRDIYIFHQYVILHRSKGNIPWAKSWSGNQLGSRYIQHTAHHQKTWQQ